MVPASSSLLLTGAHPCGSGPGCGSRPCVLAGLQERCGKPSREQHLLFHSWPAGLDDHPDQSFMSQSFSAPKFLCSHHLIPRMCITCEHSQRFHTRGVRMLSASFIRLRTVHSQMGHLGAFKASTC